LLQQELGYRDGKMSGKRKAPLGKLLDPMEAEPLEEGRREWSRALMGEKRIQERHDV